MGRQHYTDEQRANALAALAANGGNVKRTAKQIAVPRKTLSHWKSGRVHPEVAKLGHQKQGDLADKLEGLAHRLVEAMPAKIEAASLHHVAVAFGIVVDKMLLLRQATIANAQEMSDEERLRRINEIATRIRQRRLAASEAGKLDGSVNGVARNTDSF
jgi:transposase-like protein